MSPCFSCRSLLVICGFAGFIVIYSIRVILSLTMVAMVVVNSTSTNSFSTQSECIGFNSSNQTITQKSGEFQWNEREQGVILGSFFWGYLVTQIPGAYVAHRFSAKWTYGIGALGSSLLTLLTPLAARYHYYALISVRVFQGLFEGVTLGSMHTLLGRWLPPMERSKMTSIVYSGTQMGIIIGQSVAGFLCDTDFLGGWPSVFYTFGCLGVIWFCAWIHCVYDHPQSHPRISEAEKSYIVTSIAIRCPNASHQKVPWAQIVKSPAFLSLTVVHAGNNWSWYTLITCLPTYMATVLGFKIKENGFLSSLPYLCDWFVIVLAGFLADFIRSRGILSTVTVRKIWIVFGFFSVASGLVAVGYVGCDYILSIVFLCFAMGLSGFSQSGFTMNHMDIAPQYAGSLVGVTNTVATLPGILGPLVVGVITQHGQTREHWITIFYISAAISVFAAVVFAIFGSGELQPWAAIEIEKVFLEGKDIHVCEEDESKVKLQQSAPLVKGTSLDSIDFETKLIE